MKKYDVVVAVAKSTGVTQKEVEKVIDSLSSVIVENVRDGGDTINLPALGMFKQKNIMQSASFLSLKFSFL